MISKVILPAMIALAGLVLSGCQQSMPTTGGDIPVTAARLQGTTLAFIRNKDLLWKFTDAALEFTNNGFPIPGAFASEVLGQEGSPNKITASWELKDDNSTLRLFNVMADGEPSAAEVSLPISPAGKIRINLGSHQYNLRKERVN